MYSLRAWSVILLDLIVLLDLLSSCKECSGHKGLGSYGTAPNHFRPLLSHIIMAEIGGLGELSCFYNDTQPTRASSSLHHSGWKCVVSYGFFGRELCGRGAKWAGSCPSHFRQAEARAKTGGGPPASPGRPVPAWSP